MTNNHKNNKDKGFVLIAVLILIAILVVIIFEFAFNARLKLHLAQNYNNADKAINCAESGLAIAKSIITETQNAIAGIEPEQNQTSALSAPRTLQVPNGTSTIVITEESGKLNVNKLKNTAGKIDKEKVSHLLRIFEKIQNQLPEASIFAPSIIANIIDFTDPDDKISELTLAGIKIQGSESKYYQSLENPYPCKNAPLAAIEELLLVKEISTEILNGFTSQTNDQTATIPGLKQYLTVYGNDKIDINTASPAVIQSLSDQITPAIAQSIVQMRTNKPFTSLQQLSAIPSITPEALNSITKLLTVNPTDHYYNIQATGTAGQFTRKINVIIKKDKSGKLITILRKEI